MTLFNGCSNITKINIPASVQKIEGFAFLDTIFLEKIEVDEANENYSSEDGVLFNKNKTSLELYPQGKKDSVYTVPNTVTTIKSYSICEFSYNLEKFIVLNNVTEISDDPYRFASHSNNLTIYGYEGSVIQEYANMRGINFVAINDSKIKVTINTDKTTLKTGEEFEVQVNVNELNTIENGIIAFSGSIDYDSDLLEMINMESQNDWDENEYNEYNFKFITTNNKFITEDGTIFKIKFKVKDITTEQTTTIKIKDIIASNGKKDIESEDAEIEINITIPEETTITSEKYDIQQDENFISKILPNTTLKDFISNINTNSNVVVTDKDGNPLSEDDIIGTGMKLKAENFELTLVITADLNGDGKITITDLAKSKLHYIESEELTGAYLKASDIDGNNAFGINDIAQIKLVIIGLMVLE